jgi:flagellar biosynthesis regulator FlaF
MYQFPYSEICDELPSQSPPKPRRLSDALELIEAAQCVPAASHEWLGVLSDFRKLWLSIAEDFPAAAPGKVEHAPPAGSLAEGILREIERCRFHPTESISFVRMGKWLQ